MEITKINSKGVFIKGKNGSVAIDPFNPDFSLDLQGKKPDIILASKTFLEIPELEENMILFSWPGEFEANGIAINAHIQYPEEKDEDNKKNVFTATIDGLKICYLRTLTAEMHSDLIEKIGDIDLLIMPANNQEKISTNTLEEIGPNGILPIDFDGSLDAFLKQHGLTAPDPEEKISLSSRADFKSDKIDVFLLK